MPMVTVAVVFGLAGMYRDCFCQFLPSMSSSNN